MKRKCLLFTILLLATFLMASCDLFKEPLPDGTYKDNGGQTLMTIRVSNGVGTITSLFTGSKTEKIEFFSDGTFATPQCKGTWRIWQNEVLTSQRALILKGLKYKCGNGVTTNPSNEYPFTW